MVWCRKVWRDIAAFRCESCPDAVEVNRTLLCGRLPGTAPDPQAIAEAAQWGQLQKPKGGRTSRRNGRARKPATRLNVTMRDKGEAADQAGSTSEVAAAEPAGKPPEPARPRRVRRASKGAAARSVPKAPPAEGAEDDGPAVHPASPTERKQSGRRRGGKGRRRGRGGNRHQPDSRTTQ